MYDPIQMQGWACKGLEGCINMMEEWTREGVVFSEHFALELRKQADRLEALTVEQEEARR